MALEDARSRQALLLEQELEELERQLTERYYQFGRDIYEAAERGVSEINRLVDRLVEAKVKHAALCREAQCPACLALNDGESIFCRQCGEKLPRQEPERTEET